ncbi:MAG: hypothetical protein WCL32_22495 [Planctomycetota bacterium]
MASPIGWTTVARKDTFRGERNQPQGQNTEIVELAAGTFGERIFDDDFNRVFIMTLRRGRRRGLRCLAVVMLVRMTAMTVVRMAVARRFVLIVVLVIAAARATEQIPQCVEK